MTAFYPGTPAIEAYGGGGFRFAGMSHRGSIMVLPSGVYEWPADSMNLTVEDFVRVFNEKVDINLMLLGTGLNMSRPPRAVREAFEVNEIMLDFMTTSSAISTYNLLLAERRKVAAALMAVA